MNTYQLYFGRLCPNGHFITDDEWNEFITYAVDTAFPDYILSEAVGVWDKNIERVMILTVCTDDRQVVLSMVNLFKEQFCHDSVGMITLPTMEIV